MQKLIAAAFVAGLGLCGASGAAFAANVEWQSYNGNLSSDRFSPLKDITPQNAADLREVCETSVGDEGVFEPGPLMIGDTLYITTMHTVVALNATDCSVRWRYVHKVTEDEPFPANRGVAYADGKLYRGTGDGWLLCLDAATGKEIWRTKIADPKVVEFLAASPIVWNGLVFLGPSGSDWGIHGRMTAFDANTGKEVWRFNIIPNKGEPGYESWHIPETSQHGGGGTWTSYTLDPVTGELFVPTGNPAPVYAPDTRPGDNLYTNAMIVLDAKTGALKWYYQLDPNDGFDYDLAAAPILYTNKAGEHRVAMGSKDGYLYVLDRTTHKLVTKTAITTVTPPSRPSKEGTYACPGSSGGVEWNGPAFSPDTNMIYVGSVDWCMDFVTGPDEYNPPAIYLGTLPNMSKTKSRTGWVYAVNGNTGKPAWKYHAETPVLSGVTPTAGGVLFSGESLGNLLVFNAKTGELLKKENLGGSLGSGVITYSVADKQYVATTAGNISHSGLATGEGLNPRVIILTTGLDQAYQPKKVAAVPPDEKVGFGGSPGKTAYNIYCTGCHGLNGTGGEGGPPLLNEASRKSVAELVAWIRNPNPPMPKLAPPMTNTEVNAVAEYVESLK